MSVTPVTFSVFAGQTLTLGLKARVGLITAVANPRAFLKAAKARGALPTATDPVVATFSPSIAGDTLFIVLLKEVTATIPPGLYYVNVAFDSGGGVQITEPAAVQVHQTTTV